MQTNSCPELHGKAMQFWAWTFYLSKFYEFVDTMILVMRKIRPSFLQVFHHCGAVSLLWLIVKTRNPPVWAFVVLNSFIHTLMYTYYALTSLGIRPPVKQLITSLQLLQFVTGLTITTVFYWYRDPAPSQEQFYALLMMQSYTATLCVLFVNFSYQTYFVKARKVSHQKVQIKEA
jgi:hypothetical protein